MVKLRCMTLDGGFVSSNTYRGVSGENYMFHRGMGTEINNREDAEGFLNSGGFKKYSTTGKLVDDTKKALSEIAKEMPVEKEVKEEVESKVEEPEKTVYTFVQLKAESKRWQINKLKELDAKKIPGLEDDRIKMILKLQGGD